MTESECWIAYYEAKGEAAEAVAEAYEQDADAEDLRPLHDAETIARVESLRRSAAGVRGTAMIWFGEADKARAEMAEATDRSRATG